MSRALALAMTRPHERLGLPVPLGRRLPQGVVGWNIMVASLTVVLSFVYIVQVNRAASQGFNLRDMEKKVEALQTDVMSLEDKVATLSSVKSLSDHASQLGFVSVDRLEFVNPASRSYAMAR